MHILYYISSHGYGHGARSCAICNQFSPDVKLTIRSMLPEHFFQEELTRPFFYYPGQFDCGCVQSDSITVDIKKTLQTYMDIADKNENLLEREVQWCRENNVTGIVSDIPSFAFEVGYKTGVPSVAVSNFSWLDIYEPYLDAMPSFRPYLDKIVEQYHMADLLLALTPPNPMKCFSQRVDIPVVGRKGITRKDEIIARYGINKDKKIGLTYTGDSGMDSIPWKKLECFDEWEFIGLYPLPGYPANYHLVNKGDFLYQDISASVDLMISKIGYGLYSECLINGVPLLYVPRTNFAEYSVLEKAIIEWGHGYPLAYNDFYTLKWDHVLQKVKTTEPPEKTESNGASVCACRIETFFGSDTNYYNK